MTSLVKRLSVSTVLITISLFSIFCLKQSLFLLVIEFFSLVGFYELLGLFALKGIDVHKPLALVLGFFLPVACVFSLEPIYFVGVILALFIFYMRNGQDKAALSMAATVFGLIYVVWFFSYTVKIRIDFGPAWVFYAILLVKGGDAGAYFVGSRFGKTKLMETISPHKSWEGAWGGLATTIVLSVISGLYLRGVSVFHLILLGSLIGVVSQLGDLVESLLKRNAGVKDSGNMPGLGGVLDVLDSILLVMPVVYFYLHLNNLPATAIPGGMF